VAHRNAAGQHDAAQRIRALQRPQAATSDATTDM